MKINKNFSGRQDEIIRKNNTPIYITKKQHFSVTSIFGFTLTELVVVITILAILGTIGFIGIQGYSARARDSVRITDMSTLLKGLSVWKAQADTYPIPENAISILAGDGSVISYQGYLGDVTSRQIHMDKTVLDPKDQVKYAYAVDVTKKKVQIIGYMESGVGLQLMTLLDPVNIAFAAVNYMDRHIYVMGDQIGVLTTATNAPVQDTYTGTGVNLGAIDTTGMTAYFGGTAYGAGKSTGTGDILISQMLGAVNGTIPCNPMTYSGYTITALSHNETKSFTKSLSIAQGTGTGTLQIQCLNGDLDMIHANENVSVSCTSGYVNTGNNLCVADVCGGSVPANSEVLVGTTQTISQNWTKGTGVAGVCTFECKVNYTWNAGSSTCIANTQIAPACNGSVASNATSNATTTSWTQTWNGSTWLPVYTFTQNITPGICTYTCNTGYTWNSGSQICVQNTYTVSGSFGSNAAGQSISVCGTNVTADGSGNFSRANVPHGTVCNNVSASRAGYTCTTSVNGPTSVTSAISNISGNCSDITAPTISNVTTSSPACATVRITINGATDTVALQVTPYSFDGGSSWQASAYKDFSGTSYTIAANLIKVRDAAGNVYTHASSVNGTATSCAVNCTYNTYQGGTCSASCGGGSYGLYYTKTITESGGGTCPISEGQFASWGGSSCNTQACPVNGVCNNAVQYACSAGSSTSNSAGSCGGSSTWTCAGLNGGSSASCSKANAACPINGGWSGWNYWYSANYGCNNYTYDYYIRYCNNPAPANGGASCSGGDTTYNTYYNGACCVGNMGSSCIAYDSGWTDSSQLKFAGVWCSPGPYWVTYSSCPSSDPESYCTVGCGYHVYGTIQCNGSCQ